jgi:fumarate reductase subunit C
MSVSAEQAIPAAMEPAGGARERPRTRPRTYQAPLGATWWLRKRRTQAGAGYYAYTSPGYVVFSLICLVFAIYHSVTWLGISGLILNVPIGERSVPPRVVTGANYALWVVATIVVGALLIWLAP